MAEKKKKKVKKNNNALKANIWKIVNFLLIMVSIVLLAVIVEVVSIAAVAANASKGEEVFELTVDVVKHTNFSMNRVVFTVMSIFAFAHFINYAFYILKKRPLLIGANAAELVFAVLCISYPIGLIVLLPMLSGLVYLRILRLEEK